MLKFVRGRQSLGATKQMSARIAEYHNALQRREGPEPVELDAASVAETPAATPSNREECSLRFETPDNTGNEQRCVLGSALLEEEYVLRCLNARAITEAA